MTTSLRPILESAVAVELESTVAAVANWISAHLHIDALRLFELRPGAIDIREVAVWHRAIMERPRSRISLDENRVDSLFRWFTGRQPATLERFPDAPELVPAGSRVLAASLVVEGQVCGFVTLETDADPPVVDIASALMPIGLVLALSRAEQTTFALRSALDHAQKRGGARVRISSEMPEVIGGDAGLAAVMQRVLLVRTSDLPVLLLGETGSGKEVVAREIHAGSPRSDGPFVRVNCGAIPPNLIDSVLFGHERGSFTGASHQHKGWFERASSGTLFLDEVGELPPEAQVRLLRVLQDGTIERVGGLDPIHVDCRIVAATHRDLPGMIEEGSFRDDLWYRLSAFPIEIPPLRRRPEDIPSLARFFASRTARLGIPVCDITSDDLALLRGYDWPGNVRELAMVIDRAAILGQGRRLEIRAALGGPRPGTLRPTHDTSTATKIIAPPMTGTRPRPSRPAAAGDRLLDQSESESNASLDDAMRRHIESVLAAVGGRIEGQSGAAELLGINPHTLRSRMRKLGIDWSRFRNGDGR